MLKSVNLHDKKGNKIGVASILDRKDRNPEILLWNTRVFKRDGEGYIECGWTVVLDVEPAKR